MTSTPRSIAALALLLVAAPTVAAQEGHAPSGATVQVSAPSELLGFRMVDEHRFDVASQGVRFRYEDAAARLWFDVFVYPAPRDPSCGGGCDSAAVHNEANGFTQLADVLVQQGRFEKLRVVTDEVREAGGLRGRYLRMVGTQGGQPIASHAYLLGAGDLLLKTRATYAPSAETDALLHRFVEAYAAQLRSASVPYPSKDGGAKP